MRHEHKSAIEWTDETWNPIVGCSIVSPGCTNCYAMKMAGRLEKMNRTGGSGSNYVNHYDGTTKRVNGNTVWTGKLARAAAKTLLEPLRRKKPTKYFVNSMGDLFHEDCPNEWIDQVFAVMALCPQHTFQVLTKRAQRMLDYLAADIRAWEWTKQGRKIVGRPFYVFRPLPNVWLGVSCERQEEADERIPLLLQTPAAVRFISAEPLLGAIDLKPWLNVMIESKDMPGYPAWTRRILPSLDWVIVAGGESGRHARPAHPQWLRALCDQCADACVAYFFKQWGAWVPEPQAAPPLEDDGKVAANVLARDGTMSSGNELYTSCKRPMFVAIREVGKKAAGRLLDGRTLRRLPNLSLRSPVRPPERNLSHEHDPRRHRLPCHALYPLQGWPQSGVQGRSEARRPSPLRGPQGLFPGLPHAPDRDLRRARRARSLHLASLRRSHDGGSTSVDRRPSRRLG